jgi:DnaJ-domain-containing protein 1
MTSVGRRPTLDELLIILDAIVAIEADVWALDPKSETFRVILSFARERLTDVPDWGDGQPKPSWLFEEIKEHLRKWETQQVREAQWVSKEEGMGSSIDTLMAHFTEELKKSAKATPQNVVTRMQTRIYADTILRLRELKERREAGGVYSQTESRREKARKAWAEDEFEGPQREEEQTRRREQANTRYEYRPQYDEGIDPELRRRAEEMFRNFNEQAFRGAFTRGWGHDSASSTPPPRQPPPNTAGKRPWYSVLGVTPKATKKEITHAYRKLAAKFHPDRYKEADGHEKMAEINTARDTGLGGL